jgi:hypothetical protein
MKNSKNLLAILLLIVIQISCYKGQQVAQPIEATPEKNATLSILFDDAGENGFSNKEKQLITDIIIHSEKEVRKLLPTLPEEIEVTAVLIDRNVDIVGGVTGRADAPGVVIVELSRVFPGGVSAAAQSALSSTIFHEFHHLERGWTIQGNKFGAGIPIAAVNEGLASVFAEEYTGVYFEEAYSYPEDTFKWLEEILLLPRDANYSTWMMGEHPDGRNSIGYRVGRYIAHQAMAISGKNIIELSKLSPNEILGIVAKR